MMRCYLKSAWKSCGPTYCSLTKLIKQSKLFSNLIGCQKKITHFRYNSGRSTSASSITASVAFPTGFLCFTKVLCSDKNDIEVPDPVTLSTETLLRNSTFAVVESTTAFLSQVTVSLAESYEQYTKALYILIKLMEYRLKVLDNVQNETKLSDLILEAKASVNKFRMRNQELQSLYMSAYNLVTEASTAAFTAGSEFHSTVATSLMQSSEIHLIKGRKDLQEAEGLLREMEAKVIHTESEHAEKQRQKNEREVKEELNTLQKDNSEEIPDLTDLSENEKMKGHDE